MQVRSANLDGEGAVMDISGHWNGNVFGTNTGNLHIEIQQNGAEVAGSLRFADAQFGINIFSVSGKSTDEGISLTITPTEIPPQLQAAPGTVTASIAPDGSMQGTWETGVGSGGTFRAFRHVMAGPAVTSPEPQQLFNRSLSVGAIRMGRKTFEHVVATLRKDFVVGRPVVTYLRDGNEVSEYADAFFQRLDVPEKLENVKLTIQEQEPNGLYNKQAVVELQRNGVNSLRTSGTNESWVLGKGTALFSELRRSEKKLLSTYATHGPKMNLLITLLLLVLLPQLDLLNRTIYAVFMVALIWGLSTFHTRFIPMTVIELTPSRQSRFTVIRDQTLSWLLTVLSGFAATWLFWFLFQRGQ